jgi:hypothetical protein
MRRLRLAHEPAASARPALAQLARRFPGALRELDALPLAIIEERLSALDHAEADPRERPAWMVAQIEYHALARGALGAKRWLGRERAVDRTTVTRFVEAAKAKGPREGAELLAWAGDLASVARPPGGKLTHVVFAKLGERLGMAPAAARTLVIPGRAR